MEQPSFIRNKAFTRTTMLGHRLRTGISNIVSRHHSNALISPPLLASPLSSSSSRYTRPRHMHSSIIVASTTSNKNTTTMGGTYNNNNNSNNNTNNNDNSTSKTFPPPPPRLKEHPIWTEEVWASPLHLPRRIFCNRTLNMKSIKAVGFDMDYTLASYKPDSFETLAHNQTVDKLVKFFGYPPSLYSITFDWRYMTRGLVIDKERGNIIKVDRHKYVKLAYHGFQEMPREERMNIYNTGSGQNRNEFDGPHFALIDTLFSLAEAHLFMSLVELADKDPGSLPHAQNYAALYRDVRGAVDLCHRDGSIKREVAQNPEKYIHADPALVTVLTMMRRSGKKVFLATNSLWDYTSVVMNWVIGGKTGKQRDDAWLDLFDVVVTGCGKPRFFTERKDLFEVHPTTGMLWNTEGGSPMIPIGEADLPSPMLASTAPTIIPLGMTQSRGSGSSNISNTSSGDDVNGKKSPTRVFQGGCYMDLHKMLGVTAGAEVLYVGDHIYGDVLRSKKDLGWRTMLVIPELESELNVLETCKSDMTELKMLRNRKDALDDQIQRLEWRLNVEGGGGLPRGGQLNEESLLFEGRDGMDEGGEIKITIPTSSQSTHSSSPSSSASTSDTDSDSDSHELLINLKDQRLSLKERHRSLLKCHHETFHPVWGQLFKTGYQNSRYAHQVERFACLYTSHVSNMMFYSPLKSYKAQVDSMVHEQDVHQKKYTTGLVEEEEDGTL